MDVDGGRSSYSAPRLFARVGYPRARGTRRRRYARAALSCTRVPTTVHRVTWHKDLGTHRTALRTAPLRTPARLSTRLRLAELLHRDNELCRRADEMEYSTLYAPTRNARAARGAATRLPARLCSGRPGSALHSGPRAGLTRRPDAPLDFQTQLAAAAGGPPKQQNRQQVPVAWPMPLWHLGIMSWRCFTNGWHRGGSHRLRLALAPPPPFCTYLPILVMHDGLCFPLECLWNVRTLYPGHARYQSTPMTS